MTPRRLILILTTLLLLSKSTESFNCSNIIGCECTQSPDRGYDLFCPESFHSMVKVSFDFDSEQALEIECNTNENYFNFLPTKYLPPDTPDLKLKSLRFKKCYLPQNVTVKDVMQELKIDSTTSFRISYSDLRNLSRSDLKGLENIIKLEVLRNTIEKVTEDLIYDLKDLESIDIQNNNIVVPQKFFWESHKLSSIELAENTLPENTTELFKNQRSLKHLNMWMMNIKTIHPDIFKGLLNLRKLDLSLNKISTLPAELFKDLHNLEILSLRRNRFETLPLGLFDKNPNLEVVYLGENIHLTDLPEDLLSNKKYLKNITLDQCALQTLPSSTFNNSDSLELLDLAYNQLRVLPEDLLHFKTSLRFLNLEKNALTHLSSEFFRDLSDLEYLNLNDNNLILTSNNFDKQIKLRSLNLVNNTLRTLKVSFRNLRQLRELDLSYNELTLLDNASFDPATGFWSVLSDLNNLEVLDLQRNNISVIFTDWKITKSRLRELNLSNNTFTNLTYIDLDFSQTKITINLEHNSISDIDMSRAELEKKIELLHQPEQNPIPSYRKSYKEITVFLNNNPLHCSCNLYDLYRYFDLTMDPEVHFTLKLLSHELYCQSPENMANKRVDQIKSKLFICQFDNNKICPEIATCYYRPYGKVLTVDLSSQGLMEAPMLTAFMENKTMTFEKKVVLLQENNIKEMPKPGMGYEKVEVLDLSNNFIENVEWVPENLEVLQLNDNKLTYLSDKMLSSFNNSHLTNLSLFNNPWTCNCSTVGFLKFIQDQYEKLEQRQDITCHNTNQEISELSIDDLCPFPTYLIVFICVFVAIISIFFAILVFLYNRFNMEIKVWLFAHQQCLWLVTEEEIDRDKLYDAFISYSHKDEDFIIPELIEKLENGPNSYKLCLHFRNWQPGEFISKNIANSIADSRRTIVILSKNFLESEWGKMEFRVAHKQALEENRARVIIILLGETPFDNLDDEMKAYLNTNTYLTWGDPWFWDKLRYALPHSHVKSYEIYEKGGKDTDFCNVPITPIQTTPPIDKFIVDPMKNNDALNVTLVNGSLVNGYVNHKMNDSNQLFGSNADLYDCEKFNDVNNKLNNANYIIR